ncbi:MAG: F-box protein, partial [Anaerolineae bacterium]
MSIRGFTFIPTAPQGEAQTVPPPHLVELGTVCSRSQSYRTFAILKDISEPEVTKNEAFSKEGARVCRKIQRCLDNLSSFCKEPECWGQNGFRFKRIRIPNTFETDNFLECGGDVFKRCQDILTKHLSAPKAPPVWMPKELWMKTFSFLEDPNLISASHVSKEWRTVIQEICKERFSKEYSFYPINPLLTETEKYLQAKYTMRNFDSGFFCEKKLRRSRGQLSIIKQWKDYLILHDPDDLQVLYFNLKTQAFEKDFLPLQSSFYSPQVWKDTLIVINRHNNQFALFNLQTKTYIRSIDVKDDSTFGKDSLISAIINVAENKLIAADPYTLKIIDLATNFVDSFDFNIGEIAGLQCHEHNLLLKIAPKTRGEKTIFQIFDIQTKTFRNIHEADDVGSYRLLEDTLILGKKDGKIVLLNLKTSEEKSIEAHKTTVNKLHVFQGLLISFGEEIKIWNLRTQACLLDYKCPANHWIKNLTFAENSLFFIVGSKAADHSSFHQLNFLPSNRSMWEDIAENRLDDLKGSLSLMPISEREDVAEIFYRWSSEFVNKDSSYLGKQPETPSKTSMVERFAAPDTSFNKLPDASMKQFKAGVIRHYAILISSEFKAFKKALDEKNLEAIEKTFLALPDQLQKILTRGIWFYCGMDKNDVEIGQRLLQQDPSNPIISLVVEKFIQNGSDLFNQRLIKAVQGFTNLLSTSQNDETILFHFQQLHQEVQDLILKILWTNKGYSWVLREEGNRYARRLLNTPSSRFEVLKASHKLFKITLFGLNTKNDEYLKRNIVAS